MQVLNNQSAFSVWKNYTSNVNNLRNSMSKLSSGLKIQGAGDDPAGLAMSERLRAQYRNSAAAASNIENSISYLQTSDSWLQKMHDILGRMDELGVAAQDGAKSQTDLDNLQTEFAQLQGELRRIGSGTSAAAKYNGKTLFQGANAQLQVGPDNGQTFTLAGISLHNTATAAVGTIGTTAVKWSSLIASNGISVASTATIQKLNMGIDFISKKRATVGAQQSRLNHTLEGLRNYEDNIRASESRIRDVDVAKETTSFSKYQILTQIGTAMMAQANNMPGGVVQLLG